MFDFAILRRFTGRNCGMFGDADLDSLDRKILELLQRDNRCTYEEIASRVGSSPSVCRRRVLAFRKAGIIQADVSIVDASAVGLRCRIILLITLKHDDATAHNRLRKRMNACAEVVSCNFVTGTPDYVVEVVLPDASDYDDFCERVITEDPDIERCESLVVIKSTKLHSPLPIPRDG